MLNALARSAAATTAREAGVTRDAVEAQRPRDLVGRAVDVLLQQRDADAAVARAIATMKGAVEKARSDAAREIAEAKADADRAEQAALDDASRALFALQRR